MRQQAEQNAHAELSSLLDEARIGYEALVAQAWAEFDARTEKEIRQ